MANTEKFNAIEKEAAESRILPTYPAVNGLWVCLVKLANLLPRSAEEHEQVASMLRGFSREQAHLVVSDAAVDALLNMNPPLETVLSADGERLHPIPVARHCARVRQRRVSDPKAALAALFELLQRIRDKREHGFKTPDGPRDQEILTATVSILDRLIQVALVSIKAVTARPSLSVIPENQNPQVSPHEARSSKDNPKVQG
jgi:hypothetical protein